MDLEKAKDLLGEMFSFNADFLYSTVKQLDIQKSDKILDIGTGFGTMAIILALQDYKVLTGEPEGDNWSNWRESAKKVGVDKSIAFKYFQAEDLPFTDDSFDTLFSYNSFHHIDEKHLAMREFKRVINSEGIIVLFEFTLEGVLIVRTRMPNHPDNVDPRDYTDDLALSSEIIEGRYVNAYIFKKIT
ncbi:MAG: class I SAM-dependent methyltransferase [Promethearchaeota archaeon]